MAVDLLFPARGLTDGYKKIVTETSTFIGKDAVIMKLWVWLFGMLIASPVLHAEVLFTVAYEDKTQFPYYVGEGSDIPPRPGAAVELIRLLEHEVSGLKVELRRLPWARCLADLEAGAVDGIFNASFKTERTKLGAYPWRNGEVDISRRLTTITYALYSTQGNVMQWNGTSFGNPLGVIGAPRGYSIVDDLRKMGVVVEEANSSLQNLHKLMSKRVGMVALQVVTGDFLLARHATEFSTVSRITPPLDIKPYYLMVSLQFQKKHPQITEDIWNAVARLRENKLNALMERYF